MMAGAGALSTRPACGQGPTVAHVARFTVHRSGGSLRFQWTMAVTRGAMGFNLYSGLHRLNGSLIGVHPSRSYSYSVRSRARGMFTLHVVLRNGGEIAVPRN